MMASKNKEIWKWNIGEGRYERDKRNYFHLQL
jgi:hypothetical protein